ncbi:hypothetical protein Q2T40_18765 [Winogradskyella maritima]|uniref:Polysaccharide chain length determinant N-terminal domain-containing protein n=1 Tax=Winogradskyella maritima TaxID=1517766 RepID=A0ABV8ADN4_9FLAO|nr:hypothetical protein [Winogradskyella maritima]
MSENLKPAPQNEEVDLGQLFKMIGNAFQKFFDFIASIFKGLFHVLMLILAHLFKNVKWYAVAVVLGLVVGYFLDKTSEKLYGANMYIETNLGSAYQVYENIQNLNQLASIENDSIRIAELLGLEVSEAAKLKEFHISPVIDPNRSIKQFSEFYNGLDSLTKTTTTYESYMESLNVYSFKIHKIGVASTDNLIYEKLNKNFDSVISKNAYLDSLLMISQKNLERNERTLIQQEKVLDSVINTYLKIRVRESEKTALPNSGTSIYMADAQGSKLLVNEAPLLKEKLELNEQIRSVNYTRVRDKDVISVISDFPTAGYDIQEWYQKKKIILPIISLVFTILFFSLVSLNKYVKSYSSRTYLRP